MLVYRFERNGIGPFVTRESPFRYDPYTKSAKYSLKLRNKLTKRLSQEQSDNLYTAHMDRQYIFGCKEKIALRAYFGTSFKTLFAAGYRIKKYTVPDSEVLDIGLEVAFPAKYHKLRSRHNVKETQKRLAIKT